MRTYRLSKENAKMQQVITFFNRRLREYQDSLRDIPLNADSSGTSHQGYSLHSLGNSGFTADLDFDYGSFLAQAEAFSEGVGTVLPITDPLFLRELWLKKALTASLRLTLQRDREIPIANFDFKGDRIYNVSGRGDLDEIAKHIPRGYASDLQGFRPGIDIRSPMYYVFNICRHEHRKLLGQ